MTDMFAQHRKAFFDKMAPKSIAILTASPEYQRTHELNFNFRQNSNFYYLTGFIETETVAVFIKDENTTKYYLFSRPHDPERERWFGSYIGQDRAVKDYHASDAYPIDQLDEKMPELLTNCKRLYYTYGYYPQFDYRLNHWIRNLREKARAGVTAPTETFDIEKIVHEMRLIKSKEEIVRIQKAIDITAAAQKRVMKACRPGLYEYDIEAEIRHEFTKSNAKEVAFEPIVASGGNACILHYTDNNAKLKEGDLLLVDIGCEYNYYAGDITRTFPVNGKFTKEQRAIYELVLQTQLAVIDQVKSGANWFTLQEMAIRKITEGLCQLEILKGNVDELIHQETYKQFYMHFVSHWLGIDGHDTMAYQIDGKWRTLQSGMVLTIEPGIYITPAENVDKKWWHIGVRIEDDLVVTENSHEILTKDVPKTIEDIEAFMRK